MPVGAVVRLPGEAEQFAMGGIGVTMHAARADTGSAFVLIETNESVVGVGPPLHTHRDASESFLVLSGEYLMHLDGHDFRCAAGSFIYVPMGMPHTFKATGEGNRKLNLFAPAAMEGYFRELAAAIRDGAADEYKLADIAERYSMDVLGPAPEGYL